MKTSTDPVISICVCYSVWTKSYITYFNDNNNDMTKSRSQFVRTLSAVPKSVRVRVALRKILTYVHGDIWQTSQKSTSSVAAHCGARGGRWRRCHHWLGVVLFVASISNRLQRVGVSADEVTNRKQKLNARVRRCQTLRDALSLLKVPLDIV